MTFVFSCEVNETWLRDHYDFFFFQLKINPGFQNAHDRYLNKGSIHSACTVSWKTFEHTKELWTSQELSKDLSGHRRTVNSDGWRTFPQCIRATRNNALLYCRYICVAESARTQCHAEIAGTEPINRKIWIRLWNFLIIQYYLYIFICIHVRLDGSFICWQKCLSGSKTID